MAARPRRADPSGPSQSSMHEVTNTGVLDSSTYATPSLFRLKIAWLSELQLVMLHKVNQIATMLMVPCITLKGPLPTTCN